MFYYFLLEFLKLKRIKLINNKKNILQLKLSKLFNLFSTPINLL
jgi:hypothetical protein